MSNDFEVMPIGTLEEIQAMRKFANELIVLSRRFNDTPRALRGKIEEMHDFYVRLSEKYPVNV